VEDNFLSLMKLLLNVLRKLGFAVPSANKYDKNNVEFTIGMSNICPIYSNKLLKPFLKFKSHNCVKYHTKLPYLHQAIQTSRRTLVDLAEIILGFTNSK
jgi:hypothetical protein